MRRVHLAALVFAGGAGALASGGAAFGQGIAPGPSLASQALAGQSILGGQSLAQPVAADLLSATIAERFEVDDNYNLDDPSPGTSYFADTLLSLDYQTATDTQSLALGIDTGLRALWQAQQDFDFVLASPTGGNLDYITEWAGGRFDAALDYTQRQVDQNNLSGIDDNTTGPLDQLGNDSREMRYDANIGVVFGTQTNSTYELRFIGSQLDYSETTPNQVNRTTLQGLGAWTLRLTPLIASQVTANYLTYSADNESETQVDRGQVGAGLLFTPSETLNFSLGLDYAQRERTDVIDDSRETTQDNDGFGVNGTFQYQLTDLLLTGQGEYTTAAPDPRLFGFVRASYPLPRGRIGARLFQNYIGTSNGADEARVTGIALEFVRDINLVSSFGVDLGYATQVDVDNLSGEPDDPDISRMNLTATYSHALTEQVSADIGYTYRSRDEDPTSASSNAIFFQIGKTFETRP